MILAAGEGSRLRPLTLTRPKPMIPVAGTPILEYNVRLLAEHGVRDLTINLHHQPEVITEYFGDGSRFGVKIRYSYEPELLGTAGAVAAVRDLFEEDFLLVYGDNLSDCNLTALLELHFDRRAALTMALYRREDPQASGIVGVDDDGRVTQFLEKPRPDQVFSNWVNAGYLAISPSVAGAIPSGRPSDFGRDVFGALLDAGRPVYGYRMTEQLWWIDSLADYERTQRQFEDAGLKHFAFDKERR
ncbi:MAG TPA: nucleotidyltransferase family protein [Candidatus Baltobacteraceae bacterium]|jgi:NDP-sugar pyrophosphorylase family protein|nr:nucleotidyltransferase family protein [Candidatus Baltobacteraceae bacterium]